MAHTQNEPHTRHCSECSEPFRITGKDIAYVAAKSVIVGQSWSLPIRCMACRAQRRRQREVVKPVNRSIQLRCRSCRVAFFFQIRDQHFYARMGWRPPMLCYLCRKAREAAVALNNNSDASAGGISHG